MVLILKSIEVIDTLRSDINLSAMHLYASYFNLDLLSNDVTALLNINIFIM